MTDQSAADTTADDIRAAIDFNDDTASPTLATLRDLCLIMPGATPSGALAAAQLLLAAHTRELTALGRAHAQEIGRGMRERGDRRRVSYCGGMHDLLARLGRYADDFDEQAGTTG